MGGVGGHGDDVAIGFVRLQDGNKSATIRARSSVRGMSQCHSPGATCVPTTLLELIAVAEKVNTGDDESARAVMKSGANFYGAAVAFEPFATGCYPL